MAIVKEVETRVNIWTVRQKNGGCREVAVSGGWTVFCLIVYRGYYTVARRYEFYVRVARTISHE